MDKRQTFIDKAIKDKDGRVALWQRPNLLLTTWFVAVVLNKIISAGLFYILSQRVAFVAIMLWAVLEIFQGVNYVRRMLGLFIATVALWGAVMSQHGVLHSFR